MNKYGIPKNSRRKVHQYGYWQNSDESVDLETCTKDDEEVIEEVKNLYYGKKYSARETGEELGWSIKQVYSFMKRNGLERRSARETNQFRFERQNPSFEIKKNLDKEEEKLKVAGIMLYWGEGSNRKGDRNSTVDFANSDPEMIKLFMKFLRTICGVDGEKLRGYLYCYSNQDVKRLEKYWSNLTGIPLDQFIKSYVREDFDPDKKGRTKYGTFHVRYSDKKLFLQIQNWIEEYITET